MSRITVGTSFLNSVHNAYGLEQNSKLHNSIAKCRYQIHIHFYPSLLKYKIHEITTQRLHITLEQGNNDRIHKSLFCSNEMKYVSSNLFNHKKDYEDYFGRFFGIPVIILLLLSSSWMILRRQSSH